MTNINTVAKEVILMKQPTLRFGQWTFTPGLMSSLTTLLFLPLLVYLGFWQLERADEKRVLENKLESRLSEKVLELGTPPPASETGFLENEVEIDKVRYRQLKVTGTFLNEQQILLDNQIYQGKAGYHVITPFLLQDNPKILLVDRGWIPVGENRKNLPQIPPLLGQQTLMGTINQTAAGLQLKETLIELHKWPLRIPRIDFTSLAAAFSEQLYPFILQLSPKDPLGFNIDPITFNMKAERHLGYAIQWFTMALAVFIYFLVINLKRSTYGKKQFIS